MSPAKTLRQSFTTVTTSAGDNFSRPILPATLASQTTRVSTYGLVDTGSDLNILPYSLGIRLGLKWQDAKPMGFVRGALERTEGRGAFVRVQIGHLPVLPLIFLWLKSDDAPLLFGVTDFFIEYDICFFQSRGFFEITQRANP